MSPATMMPGDGMIAPSIGAYSNSTATPTGETLAAPPRLKEKESEKKEEGMRSSRKATVVVELPENAKLFIDDMPIQVASGVQTFDTPALQSGRDYYYMVRIESRQNGKPISKSRLVVVRAGQVARADFKDSRTETVRTVQAK